MIVIWFMFECSEYGMTLFLAILMQNNAQIMSIIS